jgi:hypothetical protein
MEETEAGTPTTPYPPQIGGHYRLGYFKSNKIKVQFKINKRNEI